MLNLSWNEVAHILGSVIQVLLHLKLSLQHLYLGYSPHFRLEFGLCTNKRNDESCMNGLLLNTYRGVQSWSSASRDEWKTPSYCRQRHLSEASAVWSAKFVWVPAKIRPYCPWLLHSWACPFARTVLAGLVCPSQVFWAADLAGLDHAQALGL